MTIKKFVKPLAVMLLVAASSCVEAKVHTRGAYVEGNVGTLYASVNIFGFGFSQFGSLGINASSGYLFNQSLATEVGYTNYGLGLNTLDVAVKVIAPLKIQDNDFTVFAKVGPAFAFANGVSALTPFAGIGASYSMTDHLDANMQAQGISEGFFSLGLVSAGLTYYFN